MLVPHEHHWRGLARDSLTFAPTTRTSILSRWPNVFNGPYDFLDPLALRPNDAAAVMQATRELWAVYARIAAILPLLPDSALLQLGVPDSLLQFVRLTSYGSPPTFLGRFDLVRRRQGYAMFEFNSDNPGLLAQFAVLEFELATQTGQRDLPCSLRAAIDKALYALVTSARRCLGKGAGDECLIAFTAACEDGSERTTAAFLSDRLRLVPGCQCEFVLTAELEISDARVSDPAGRRIDVLYRLYPLDLFLRALVRGRGGPFVVGRLANLVSDRKVILLNPPVSFVLESKVLQAAVWGLRKETEYFSTEERSTIRRRFLPTYLDDVFGGSGYVMKPAYGRGGDSVKIFEPGTHEAISNGTCTYADQPFVYQKYESLPRMVICTESGEQELSVLTSSFVVNGLPAGVCMRAGRGVTDGDWWLVPTWVHGS